MPQIGLGTYPMSSREVERAVGEAVQAGYRLFDTAYIYRNEEGIGRGVAACGVPREQLFITTKLNGNSHGFEEAQAACVASLRRLGLDYVDLYLIHWPLPAQDRFVDAWRGHIKLKADGLARAIGVSNFKAAHIDRLIAETAVVPAVNQIELCPYTTREELRAYNQSHQIVTQSWSPIDLGGRLLREPLLTALAKRYAKTEAQIVLRWHVQLGLSAIPKSSRPDRIAANIDVFDFTLSAEEVTAISLFDRGEAYAQDSDRVGN